MAACVSILTQYSDDGSLIVLVEATAAVATAVIVIEESINPGLPLTNVSYSAKVPRSFRAFPTEGCKLVINREYVGMLCKLDSRSVNIFDTPVSGSDLQCVVMLPSREALITEHDSKIKYQLLFLTQVVVFCKAFELRCHCSTVFTKKEKKIIMYSLIMY